MVPKADLEHFSEFCEKSFKNLSTGTLFFFVIVYRDIQIGTGTVVNTGFKKFLNIKFSVIELCL